MDITPGISLVRIAIVRLSPAPQSGNRYRVEHDGLTIDTIGHTNDGNDVSLIMTGTVELKYRPKVTAANQVVVPDRERRHIESWIETLANMLSALGRTRRAISSPTRCVAFIPHTDDARAWLEGLDGIHGQSELVHHTSTFELISPTEPAVIAALGDRLDGVELLSEVASQSHALGRFRDLIRFFERAFRLPSHQLAAPVAATADPRFGVTAAEVETWLAVRGPAAHADVRRDYALERDAWPYLERMLLVATDVLLNKTTWRDPSTARTERRAFRAWTADADGSAKIIVGTTPRTQAQLLDPFGAFPCAMSELTSPPAEWWMPSVAVRTKQFPIEVVPDPDDAEPASS